MYDTETITCRKCGLDLQPDAFDFRDKVRGLRKTTCRDCVRAYSKAHYEANRDVYIARAKAGNRKTVADQRSIIAGLRGRPCTDCKGVFPPECMEFDHRSGVEKSANIADMPKRYYSKRLLAAELEKCDLVCANCHRIRTARRGTRKPAGSASPNGVHPAG